MKQKWNLETDRNRQQQQLRECSQEVGTHCSHSVHSWVRNTHALTTTQLKLPSNTPTWVIIIMHNTVVLPLWKYPGDLTSIHVITMFERERERERERDLLLFHLFERRLPDHPYRLWQGTPHHGWTPLWRLCQLERGREGGGREERGRQES